jgi:hypothetical protein
VHKNGRKYTENAPSQGPRNYHGELALVKNVSLSLRGKVAYLWGMQQCTKGAQNLPEGTTAPPAPFTSRSSRTAAVERGQATWPGYSRKGAGLRAQVGVGGGRVEREQGKVAPKEEKGKVVLKGEQGKVVPEAAEMWNDFFQSGCSDHLRVNLIFRSIPIASARLRWIRIDSAQLKLIYIDFEQF